MSFAARAVPREVAYVRFRVIAHSVALPTTGEHPPSSANAVIIGESARITNDSDWSLVVLPPWHASKDFTRLSIAVISDQEAATDGKPAGPTESPRATGLISAICVREVAGCAAVGGLLGEGPHVTIGGRARLVDDGEAVAHLVGSDLGAMIDVFGEPLNDDGRHRWYRPGDECVSVGGWIPDDLEDHVPWLHENHGVPPSEIVDKLVDQLLIELDAPDLSQLEPITLKPSPCPEHGPAPHPLRPRQNVILDPAPPFAGRDVVFVHGFVLDHVMARYVTADPVATAVHATLQGGADAEWAELSDAVGQEWPSVPDPYRVVPPAGDSDGVGYFRATTYWAPHIQQYFTEPEHPNRYIVTGYNCSQRLLCAVHMLLSQIADAVASERYVPTFGIANHEESLVVEHQSVFSGGLVNPSIASFVRRFERRLDLTIRISIAVPQITFSPPGIGWRRLVFPVTQTIWRRSSPATSSVRAAARIDSCSRSDSSFLQHCCSNGNKPDTRDGSGDSASQ